MTVSAAQVRALLAVGITTEQLIAIVEVFETSKKDDVAGYREADRLRSQRYRDRRRAAGMSSAFDGAKFRPDLIARDGENCVYCGTAPGCTIDHMVPVSIGGTDDPNNLGLACTPCNSRKAGRTPTEAKMSFASRSAMAAYDLYVSDTYQVDDGRTTEADGERTTPPPSPPSNGFPTPLPITTPSSPTLAFSAREPSDDGWPKDAGERFWKAYPHKVAKKAALRALAAARRTGVTFERLMFALDRYKLEKPPDRAWCNPATWLNGGRWDDEPATSETTDGQSTFKNRTAQAPRSGATGQDAILAGMGRLADRVRARGDAERREREASDDGGAPRGAGARLI